MRAGGVRPEASLASRLDELEGEVLKAARPAAYWRLEPVVRKADGAYAVGPLGLTSGDLAWELEGCAHAFLFVATLGTGVDALLRRYSVTSAADALFVQGLSTSLIESWCDDCGRRMLDEVRATGETLRRRFSPGYGDLPLEVQRPLLAALDATRRVGVSLTDGLLMVPSKSVSAIVGVGFVVCSDGERM